MRCLRQSLARQTRIWPLYFLASLNRAHAYVGTIELHGLFYPLEGKVQPHRCSSYLPAHAHPDIGHRCPFPVFAACVVGRPIRRALRTWCATKKRKTSKVIRLVLSQAQPSPTSTTNLLSLSLYYFLKTLLSLSLTLTLSLSLSHSLSHSYLYKYRGRRGGRGEG